MSRVNNEMNGMTHAKFVSIQEVSLRLQCQLNDAHSSIVYFSIRHCHSNHWNERTLSTLSINSQWVNVSRSHRWMTASPSQWDATTAHECRRITTKEVNEVPVTSHTLSHCLWGALPWPSLSLESCWHLTVQVTQCTSYQWCHLKWTCTKWTERNVHNYISNNCLINWLTE